MSITIKNKRSLECQNNLSVQYIILFTRIIMIYLWANNVDLTRTNNFVYIISNTLSNT